MTTSEKQELKSRIITRLAEHNVSYTEDDESIYCKDIGLQKLYALIGRDPINRAVAVIYPYNETLRVHILEDGTNDEFIRNYIASISYENDQYYHTATRWDHEMPSWIIEVLLKLGLDPYCTKLVNRNKYCITNCRHTIEIMKQRCPELNIYEENGSIYVLYNDT